MPQSDAIVESMIAGVTQNANLRLNSTELTRLRRFAGSNRLDMVKEGRFSREYSLHRHLVAAGGGRDPGRRLGRQLQLEPDQHPLRVPAGRTATGSAFAHCSWGCAHRPSGRTRIPPGHSASSERGADHRAKPPLRFRNAVRFACHRVALTACSIAGSYPLGILNRQTGVFVLRLPSKWVTRWQKTV